MTDDIERLLDYGRMGLETGQYEQAREDFEKVLALDPSNRGAMKGLARANEILSRKAATAVEPMEAETPAGPPLAKRLMVGVNSVVEALEEYSQKRARAWEGRARVREEQSQKRAREAAERQAAWEAQRAQRGGAPFLLGQCPECGSVNSKKFKDIGCKGELAFALTLPLSLLVYPLLPDAYRCKVCGAKWRA